MSELIHNSEVQVAQAVLAQMSAYTSRFIAVVARKISDTEGDFVGSGTFMVFGGQAFLVTADHVVKKADPDSTGKVVFSNGNGALYQSVNTRFCADDALDIAIAPVRLTRPPPSMCQAVPSTMIASHAGQLGDLLFVHGFPAERSRFTVFGPAIVSRTLPFGSSKQKTEWPDFDPEKHFALGFDPKHSICPSDMTFSLPNAHGMSGSAVWDTRKRERGERWQPSDARVIGVLHRWDQDARCLIGTRIEYIHGFVAKSWPLQKT